MTSTTTTTATNITSTTPTVADATITITTTTTTPVTDSQDNDYMFVCPKGFPCYKAMMTETPPMAVSISSSPLLPNTDIRDKHFVFVCANGFSCYNGTKLVPREISVATRYPTFRCETYIINVYQNFEYDPPRYPPHETPPPEPLLWSATDEMRNVYLSHLSGLPRPVETVDDFVKYYKRSPDEVFPMATFRGLSVEDASSRIAQFIDSCVDENGQVHVGFIKSERTIPWRRLITRETYNRIIFHVYDDTELAPLDVYSPILPLKDIFPKGHNLFHLSFHRTMNGCTIMRVWHYLKYRNDPEMKEMQKQEMEEVERYETRWDNDVEYHPIESKMVQSLMLNYKVFQKYRFWGWCSPVDGDQDQSEEEKKLIKFNTYCGYNINF